MADKEELSVLSHEITYRGFLMNRGRIKELFEKLSVPEYIALHNIAMEHDASSIYEGKTYLKDLSAKMELTMRQVSKMIGMIQKSHPKCYRILSLNISYTQSSLENVKVEDCNKICNNFRLTFSLFCGIIDFFSFFMYYIICRSLAIRRILR